MAFTECIAVLLLLLSFFNASVLGYSVKLCAERNDGSSCEILQKFNDFECVNVTNSESCQKAINSKLAHLGRIKHEDAVIASILLDNISVIGEIHGVDNTSIDTFQIVVILKAPVSNITELQGKSLCHPGYDLNVSRNILNEFEMSLQLLTDICNVSNADTILENQLIFLSDKLGPSCRPGSWVDSDMFDNYFKKKYSKLHKLCKNNSLDVDENGFDGALQCFIDMGDIAVTTTHHLLKYKDKLPKFYYLCRNGTSSTSSCIWYTHSRDLLIANKKEVDNIHETMLRFFSKKSVPDRISYDNITNENIKASVVNILQVVKEQLVIFDKPKNIKEYISNFQTIPSQSVCSNQDVKWCTFSEKQYQNCIWLKTFAMVHGIYPRLDCILQTDQLQCLHSVALKDADITTVHSNYSYVARRNGLSAIGFPMARQDTLTKSMIVIKNSNITSINDLQGKFGCFSKFGNIAFMSFINILYEKSLIKPSCNVIDDLTKFMNVGCVPGVMDPSMGSFGYVDSNLCVCIGILGNDNQICAAANENEYFGNRGALKCLKEIGDFAVITHEDMERNVSSKFKILCINGTLVDYVDIDDNCYISITPSTELLIQQNNPSTKNMFIALSAFEKRMDASNLFLFEDPVGTVFHKNESHVKQFLNIFNYMDDKCNMHKTNNAHVLNAFYHISYILLFFVSRVI